MPPLADRQRLALAGLTALARDRADRETAAEELFAKEAADADREVQRARRHLQLARKKALDDLAAGHGAAGADVATRYAAAESEAADARQSLRTRTVNQHSAQLQKLRSELDDKNWTLDSIKEAADKDAHDRHAELTRQAATATKHLAARWADVAPKLARVRLDPDQVAFDADRLPAPTPTDPVGKVQKALEDVDAAAEHVRRAKADRLLKPGPLAVVTLAVAAAGGGAVTLSDLFPWPVNLAVAVGVTVGGGLVAVGLIVLVARRQLLARGTALGVFQAEAGRAVMLLRAHADRERDAALKLAADRHAAAKAKAKGYYAPRIDSTERQLAQKLKDIDATTAANLADLKAGREAELAAEVARHGAATADAAAHADRELAAAEARFTGRNAAAAAARAAAWHALAADWHAGLAHASAEGAALVAAGETHFPAWGELAARPLADGVPDGVRFGRVAVDLAALPGGLPTDERLIPRDVPPAELPAFAPFPEKAAVLVKAADADRPTAVGLLQTLMLRFLTALPPGKVRFTIIDPVGLGENFAAFMHLADFDEKLVGSRIWTEPGHVQDRLSDLTEHMETVIQKYLRNQYKSIEEYNRAAGEVAEPYRVLVIANFPVNFTPEAARRLVSIMASGPACGVCTLVGVDTKAPLPRDFRLADLEQVAFTLALAGDAVTPADPALAAFPVTLDPPPPPDLVAQVVRRVGQGSLSAARVEVPFDYIAPTPDMVWKSSAAKGFDVPIGRAGATRRQSLALGRGTAQHALVAGKTGSGKSTLLHAIITNLALHYSPDEAEVYLVDFKKGVEFQAYADAQLPHARVIAVESEREFGLSVLQRLDGILRERGDKFRDAGVNDLAGYRAHLAAQGSDEKSPRVIFVVDEFQEFFVEDDKIAQEASLLLDRLVRQGRAFGVHVLLGSQTLGGAYSIPRATIDQMAVRIALQCSEADAQLILSKDNTAARLLNRPGEAIYNDANGLVEGNDPFQVVWLADGQRAELLAGIKARAAGRGDPAPLVFAGNASADLAASPALIATASGPPTVYLGDPVAITAPTAAVFRPQSGANLLLLGQHEDAALALMTSALVGLTRRGVQVLAVDATPDDAATAGYLRAAVDAVGSPAAFVDRDGLPAALAEVAADLAARLSGGAPRTPRFVLVHGLHRLRELKKAEDDYSFGRKTDAAPNPGEVFGTLLRDGPAAGIHVVAWCDSLTNLQRQLDRSGLREFAQRVLFQMSATDSSQLIDTPAAARLGRNRGLYVSDGAERPEKFRPYGLPGLAWLGRLNRAGDSTPLPRPAARGLTRARGVVQSGMSPAGLHRPPGRTPP